MSSATRGTPAPTARGVRTHVADDRRPTAPVGLRVSWITIGRRLLDQFETGRRRRQPGSSVHSYFPAAPRRQWWEMKDVPQTIVLRHGTLPDRRHVLGDVDVVAYPEGETAAAAPSSA